MEPKVSVALDNELDLRNIFTTGSTLQINADYDDNDCLLESDRVQGKSVDLIGKPLRSFEKLKEQMTCIDALGFVKKKILEEGGGLPLHNGCTVHIAFSGYWENEEEPFDVRKPDKPLVVDLNDSGLLPGVQIAVESMLVGETSVFMLSYDVMYGKLGIPPRIKPKADCVLYIKLVKSVLTSEKGKLDFSEPNSFERLYHEIKLMYASGSVLYKNRNFFAAIQLFRKAVYMLHKCHLADETEEEKQEKMLIKLYTNLSLCYNLIRQPLKTCTVCNELNRLNSLWNNGKVLFQNAKALRMIGDFEQARKKLLRAMKLCPDRKELQTELDLLERAKNTCDKSKLISEKLRGPLEEISDDFKREVDILMANFKNNTDLCKLTLPDSLNDAEIEYVKQACIKEKLYFSKIQKDYALDKDEQLPESIDQSLESLL